MTGTRTAPEAQQSRSMRFRPDVEGLRAIAILAVVGYHAGLPFLPGGFVGVDVFFVISGFLITGLLVSEVTRTGHVSLARFWARRARRLLPAATLVLALTAAVSFLVIPVVDHDVVGYDIVAAAFYVSNIRFATQATSYLTEDAAPSPVLHFWSLGVEEQFYVVWPLLILALVWVLVRRRRGTVSPRSLAIALAALGVVSFVLSLWLTARVQPWAFFGMPTRAWEFAIGGLIAIGGVALARLPLAARAAAGWVGALLLLGSIVLIQGDVQFPGWLAVPPVVGTALVILAGTRSDDVVPAHGVPALLSTWPMRAIGRLSYSWYLWHWPVLILTAAALGPLGVPAKLALVLLALVPAAVAYRFVEEPLRHDPRLVAVPSRALRLGAALSVGAAVCGLLLAWLPGGGSLATVAVAAPVEGDRGPAPAASPTAASPSATPTTKPTTKPSGKPSTSPKPSASATAITWPAGDLTPDPTAARGDLPKIYGNGCHLERGGTAPADGCAFGDTGSSTTVVLIGDSHAASWFPALEKIATDKRWRLLSWTKSGCPAPDVTIFQRKLSRAYDECDTWRATVLDRLTGPDKPALVVAAGTRTESLVSRSDGARLEGTGRAGAEWQAGWGRTLARLTEAGVPVAVMRDTPWPGKDMAVCVGQNRSNPSACDVTRDALDGTKYDVGMAAKYDGATGVDLSDVICDADRCPATHGKYLVYRDTDHLTATFSRALAPYLAAKLTPLIPPR
ncbi:MAG: acyltransferase family protein [Candidatus Nanopelagicales bacterium]